MANTIRIKRRSSGGSTGAPSSLKNGELAYNEADDNLYYGYGDDGSGNATSIKPIGGDGWGDGNFVTLDTTQSINSAKTILTGNTWTYNAGSTLNIAGTFQLGGTTVTADATELNYLDGISGVGISQNNIFKADAGIVDNDFLRVNGTVIEGRSAGEVAADIGAITTLGGAEGIDVSGTGQSRSITLDLTELPDMTAAVTRTEDELIILDNGDQSRKLISEIDLSDFNNDLSLSDFVDDVTVTYSVSASTTTGGAKLDLSDTNSPATVDSVSFLGSGATTVTRTDADTITISSNNTTYTAGTNGGLSLAGTSFSMNFGNLPDYATSPAGTDHLIIGTTGGASRVDLDDLPLSNFDDDITTVYDLAATSVTGGSRLDLSGTGADATTTSVSIIGGTNVTVTHNSATQMTISSDNTTYSAGALLDLSGTTFNVDLSELADMTQTIVGTDEFVVLDASVQKRKAAQEIPISIFNTAVATSITDVGTLVDLDVSGDATFGGDVTLSTGDVIISSGVLQGPSTFYIDPAPFDSPQANNSPAATGTVVIRGDLQVDGTTTTINSTEISITDKNMVLADDQTTLAGVDDAGLYLGDDGAGAGEVNFIYNNSNTRMELTGTSNIGLYVSGGLQDTVIDGGTF